MWGRPVQAAIGFTFLLVSIIAIGEGCINADQTTKRQQFARGKLLYQDHCQHCHKQDGEGFEKLYPPLNQVDYMLEHQKLVPCIIRHGMKGPLKIRDTVYNIAMPGNDQLTEYEIAQLMTYIYNAWDNEHNRFTVDQVRKALDDCDTVVVE